MEQPSSETKDQMQNSFSVFGFTGCQKRNESCQPGQRAISEFLTHTAGLGAKWWCQ